MASWPCGYGAVAPSQTTGGGLLPPRPAGDGDAETTGTCRYARPDGERLTNDERRTGLGPSGAPAS